MICLCSIHFMAQVGNLISWPFDLIQAELKCKPGAEAKIHTIISNPLLAVGTGT